MVVGFLVLACSGTFAALCAGETMALEEHLLPTSPRFFWVNSLERLNPVYYEAQAHEQVGRARRFFSSMVFTLLAAVIILWLAFK
jgi:hypothetical protein